MANIDKGRILLFWITSVFSFVMSKMFYLKYFENCDLFNVITVSVRECFLTLLKIKTNCSWIGQVCLMTKMYLYLTLQKPGLPHGKPESTCVLQGASLEWASTLSTKKKNAFQVHFVWQFSIIPCGVRIINLSG